MTDIIDVTAVERSTRIELLEAEVVRLEAAIAAAKAEIDDLNKLPDVAPAAEAAPASSEPAAQ